MVFTSDFIKRDYLYSVSKDIAPTNRVQLYRALILYNTIFSNKNLDLIDKFEELSDVGFEGKYKGKFNKQCSTHLLICRRDLAMIKYLALKEVERTI